jgi:hypothetical protein
LKLLEVGKSKAEIEARVNPKIKIADTYFFDAADLMRIVDRASRSRKGITSHPAAFSGVQEGARQMTSQMRRREEALKKGKDDKWGLGNNPDARERFFREKQLIQKWFSLHQAEFLTAHPTKP